MTAYGRPIFLIGFMASGKTTLLEALAARLPDRRCVDLDAAVENRLGMTVSDIFRVLGEPAFRKAEADILAEVVGSNDIVACGGGTPCRRENMDLMLCAGTVVWLVAPEDVIVRRLSEAPGQRPLVDDVLQDSGKLRERVRAYMDSRMSDYSRAHACFDSRFLETEEEIGRTASLFIEKFVNHTL